MLKLLQALNLVYQGKSIRSVVTGKTYTPKDLGISWCGTHYASWNSILSQEEIKGEFDAV